MPITPFLRGQAFDPELVNAMGAAFSETCDALGLTKRSDPITTLVAEKIIELAERGLRTPTAIHRMAMTELESNSRLTTKMMVLPHNPAREATVRGFLKRFASDVFHPDELSVLEDALDDAWRRVECSKAPWSSAEYSDAGCTILAKYIIKQAKAGERDARWLADSAILYLSKQKLSRTPPDSAIDDAKLISVARRERIEGTPGETGSVRDKKEVFHPVVRSGSVVEMLDVLVQTAMQQTEGEARAAFYIADAEGAALHHVTGMPQAYAQHVDGFPIGPQSLACGLAAGTGRAIITRDVIEDPRWTPWLWLAKEFDYRACWSFPVGTSAGKILGTFAMYYKEPREATQRDLDLAATLTSAASLIIMNGPHPVVQ